MRTNSALPQWATNKPNVAPILASNKLSVSNCRIRRDRPAPMDSRTAISRWRAAPFLGNPLFLIITIAGAEVLGGTNIGLHHERDPNIHRRFNPHPGEAARTDADDRQVRAIQDYSLS